MLFCQEQFYQCAWVELALGKCDPYEENNDLLLYVGFVKSKCVVWISISDINM